MVSLIAENILDTTATVSVSDGDKAPDFNNSVPNVSLSGFGGFTYVEQIGVEVDLLSPINLRNDSASGNNSFDFEGTIGEFSLGPFTIFSSSDSGGGAFVGFTGTTTIQPSDWVLYSAEKNADVYIDEGVEWSNWVDVKDFDPNDPKFDGDQDIDFQVKLSILGKQP